nr:protein kinase-like domain, concanavalin A-like lectin/glucanase domain protein [Tanacetum cinerariifolium]
MALKSIAAISHVEKEELRKKGIKTPSKLFSPKYLSPTSIKELNENPSAPKRVHFVSLMVILGKYSDTEEDVSPTNVCRHDLDKMTGGNKEVKEQGNEEDEMETDMEVEEVIEEEESKFETDEEVEEILEGEEDDENFNSFPTMMELSHHEWLLRILDPRRQKPSNPDKISNFVGRVRSLKIFIGSFAYKYVFMILEETTSIIDRCLEEMVFGRPFIDETGLVYNKEEGTIMFKQDNEKIKFKMPHTMEIFKQTRLMGASTDSIPPLAYKENFSNGRTHYYQSLLIRDEYKQDEGDKR